MSRLTDYIPLIFVLIWSTGFIGAKFALPYMEPFFLLVVRYALVIAIFAAALLLQPGKGMSRSDAAFQICVGVLLHGFYLGGVFYGISRGMPAGMSAIIVGLQPVVTAALVRYWLGQAVTRAQLAGLLLGMGGVVLVVAGAGRMEGGEITAPGLIATLLALAGLSVGTVLQKVKGGEVGPRSGLLLQYTGALIVTIPLTLLWETQQVEMSWTLVLTMAWLVLGLSVLAIMLLMVMIRAGQVAKVSSYFYLVPPMTVLQGWLFFGETLSPVSALGGLLAVAGVYLVIRKPSAAAAPAPASSES